MSFKVGDNVKTLSEPISSGTVPISSMETGLINTAKVTKARDIRTGTTDFNHRTISSVECNSA